MSHFEIMNANSIYSSSFIYILFIYEPIKSMC